jgi:hypothetical protein
MTFPTTGPDGQDWNVRACYTADCYKHPVVLILEGSRCRFRWFLRPYSSCHYSIRFHNRTSSRIPTSPPLLIPRPFPQVEFTVNQWCTGQREPKESFNTKTYRPVYERHLEALISLKDSSPGCAGALARLQARLLRVARCVPRTALRATWHMADNHLTPGVMRVWSQLPGPSAYILQRNLTPSCKSRPIWSRTSLKKKAVSRREGEGTIEAHVVRDGVIFRNHLLRMFSQNNCHIIFS